MYAREAVAKVNERCVKRRGVCLLIRRNLVPRGGVCVCVYIYSDGPREREREREIGINDKHDVRRRSTGLYRE